MSFFNSKEEVLDVELTQYGRLLLSRGLFKPIYYSFHDDGVIYDLSYAGMTENTNQAEKRIQDETPTGKPFYSFSEGKPHLSFDLDQEKFLSQKSNLALSKTEFQADTLSHSTISNLYIPSWKIHNLSSEFTSSSTTFNGIGVNNAPIPQFDVEIYTTFLKTNQSTISDNLRLQAMLSTEEVASPDDENVYITSIPPLLLRVLEENTDVEYDAFDVQMFKTTIDTDGNNVYTQLKFSKELDNYDEEADLYKQVSNLVSQRTDSSFADFFFESLTDKEISQINVCKYVLQSSEDQDLIFPDSSICAEIRTKFSTDGLYELSVELNDLATGNTC